MNKKAITLEFEDPAIIYKLRDEIKRLGGDLVNEKIIIDDVVINTEEELKNEVEKYRLKQSNQD